MSEIRRNRRMGGWDYASGASLFVTIATAPRLALFGEIADGKMELSELGRIVEEALEAIPRLNPGITLYGHVVMPDHVHFNCHLAAGLAEPLKVFGKAITRFKNYTTKQAKILAGHSPAISTISTASIATISAAAISTAGPRAAGASGDGQAAPGLAISAAGPRAAGASGDGQAWPGLWQQGCHDWLCLSRRFIDCTERYIAYNVSKWWIMHGCDRRLRIQEPLSSPRLDATEYWKGVGNTALLAPEAPIASLRVSRRARDIAAVVRRMESAVAKGYAIISGFISPGERAVLAMLLARKDARFIRIRPSCIPNARFKPESAYVDAFMEGRYLEIARGNDETEFGRAACLDLNREIVNIATASSGVAVYFTEQGMEIIGRGK